MNCDRSRYCIPIFDQRSSMVKPTVRMQNAHFCSHSAPPKRFMILVQTKTKRVDGNVIGDTVHVASKHHLSAFSSSRSLPKLIKCESSSRRRDPGSCNIPILSHAVMVHILIGSILESLLCLCKGFPCCQQNLWVEFYDTT